MTPFPAHYAAAADPVVLAALEVLKPVFAGLTRQQERVAAILEKHALLDGHMLAALTVMGYLRHDGLDGLPARVAADARTLGAVGTSPEEQAAFLHEARPALARLMMANLVAGELAVLGGDMRAALPECLDRAYRLQDEALAEKLTPALLREYTGVLDLIRINIPGMDRETEELRAMVQCAIGGVEAAALRIEAARAGAEAQVKSRKNRLKNMRKQDYKL